MTNEQKTEAPERIDIWIQGLIRELRNEGYLVPYPIMSKAVQAHADQVVRDMAQPVTQEAAARLLKLCDDMDGLNTTMPDENGHKWRHSDLMDQTIVQMRTAIRALATPPQEKDDE